MRLINNFLIYEWESEVVIYHYLSGDTHVLGSDIFGVFEKFSLMSNEERVKEIESEFVGGVDNVKEQLSILLKLNLLSR